MCLCIAVLHAIVRMDTEKSACMVPSDPEDTAGRCDRQRVRQLLAFVGAHHHAARASQGMLKQVSAYFAGT